MFNLTRSDLSRLLNRATPLFDYETEDFGANNIALRDTLDGHLVAIRYGVYLKPDRSSVQRPRGYAVIEDTKENRERLKELRDFYELPANAGLATALARLEALPNYTNVNA